jgi:hypothetical protein
MKDGYRPQFFFKSDYILRATRFEKAFERFSERKLDTKRRRKLSYHFRSILF